MVRLVKMIGLVAGLTLATNLLGFVREILVAKYFGTGPEADAFIGAFTIVSVCFLLFTAGTIQSAFMPRYQTLYEQSPAAAAGLFWRSVKYLFLLLLALVIGLTVMAPTWVRLVTPGFDPYRMNLAADLVVICAPMVLLVGLGILLQSVAHAHQKFAGPALVPLLTNCVIISFLIWFAPLWGIKSLAWGNLAGGALWLIILTPLIWNKVYGEKVVVPGELRATLITLGPLIVLLIADQLSSLVQKALASGLEVGGLAALNYAAKIEGLPVGIFAGAIGTVFFPVLVKARAKEDINALVRQVYLAYEWIVAILLPLSVYLCLDGELLLRIVFERGAFDATSTRLTNTALFYYSLGMVAQGLIVSANRVFFAFERTQIPMVVGILCAMFHIMFCLVAVRLQGFEGVASGTSLYAALYALLLMHATKRLIPFSWLRFFSILVYPLSAVAISLVIYTGCMHWGSAASPQRLISLALGLISYLVALGIMRRGSIRSLIKHPS